MVRDYTFNSTHMSCNRMEFVRIFCDDSEAILSRISARFPGGHIFLSGKHLKDSAYHIYFVKMI